MLVLSTLLGLCSTLLLTASILLISQVEIAADPAAAAAAFAAGAAQDGLADNEGVRPHARQARLAAAVSSQHMPLLPLRCCCAHSVLTEDHARGCEIIH